MKIEISDGGDVRLSSLWHIPSGEALLSPDDLEMLRGKLPRLIEEAKAVRTRAREERVKALQAELDALKAEGRVP